MAVLGAQRLGSWQLVERLAVGGMAELFTAVWSDDARDPPRGVERGQVVCLKRPLPHVSEDQELRAAFEAVGHLALGVRHPNIVRTLAVERIPWAPDQPYLVMERVEGRPLSSLLAAAVDSGDGLEPARVARIGAQIASALAGLHELRDAQGEPLGFVHRDVTPQNIVLRADGSAVLIDLDVACFRGRPGHTHTGAVKGKHAYASPEQFDGQPVGPRSDLFSLGVVLWELLAARRLFLGEDVLDTMERVQAAEVPDLRAVRPEVPEALASVVHDCLRRDAEDRVHDAAEVAHRLGAPSADSQPVVTTIPAVAPAAETVTPVVSLAVLAVAAATVAFVLATSWWYIGQMAP